MKSVASAFAGISIVAVGIVAYCFARQPADLTASSYGTPLAGRNSSQRHNAYLAVSKLNGAVVGPRETFSFNARVGTFSRDQGYRKAPVSYNGQLIDSWGGGVCQVSTTLYNAALLAGMRIVERHPHRFCPSYVPEGRDAAVAFNEVDLKFTNPYAFRVRIVARMTGERLVVSLETPQPLPQECQVVGDVRRVFDAGTIAVGGTGRFGRVRNNGKAGCDVAVFRIAGASRELISENHYEAMARVVESR